MASSDYPTRKLNKPCMIKLALDSPGWTLAPTIMYFLNLYVGMTSLFSNSDGSISRGEPLGRPASLLTYEVIVSSGTSRPLKEWQNLPSLI